MRRLARVFAGAVLLSMLPVTVSGCSVGCGCLATGDPNWTPPPLTAEQAAFYAAKEAGRESGTIDAPSMTAVPISGPNGRAYYEVSGTNTVALVDSSSGFVVEAVLEEHLPNDATVSVSASDAGTAAVTFMRGRLDDPSASAQVIRQAGVAVYQVALKESSGNRAAQYVVGVNASTGSVCAFVDPRLQDNLAVPIVGREKAAALAIAALGVPGETVTSAELSIDFATGAQLSTWQVRLGVPTSIQTGVFEHVGLVRVDAVTGATTIVKS